MTGYVRDSPAEFEALRDSTSERLGVDRGAVEKDYWACEALRAITVAHPGEVVFKGGTSLEKLRIIRRFSESVLIDQLRAFLEN